MVFNPSSLVNNGPSVSLVKGEFTIINGEDDDEEILEPIEESFSAGSLVELKDVDISFNELNNGDTIIFNKLLNKFVAGEGGGSNIINLVNQSLLDVITEQPQRFNLVSSNTTSGAITLEWNYDDILVNYDDDTQRILARGQNLKESMIPYIDKIHIDISGTIYDNNGNDMQHSSSNTWIPFNIGNYDINGDRTIGINDNYNTDEYKILRIEKVQSELLDNNSTLSERILSKAESTISFRIYGINDSKDNDEMKNTRAIYFNNLFFKSAGSPKKPSFITDEIVSNGIKLTTATEETELDNPVSTAKVIRANVIYNEVERLISNSPLLNDTIYQLNQNNFNEVFNFDTVIDDITNNKQFDLLLTTNIREGTRYNYNLTLTNNLVNTPSESLEKESTLFTDAPPSLHPDDLTFSILNGDKISIASDTLTASNRTYANLGEAFSNSSKTIITPQVNNETIEISSDFKFGKDLDLQSSDSILVNINVSVETPSENTINKQNVTFNGYNITTGVADFNNTKNTLVTPNTFYFISQDTSQDDMYNDDTISNYQNKMGFRLKADIKLNSVSVLDVYQNIAKDNNGNNIGGSTTPYKLIYEYVRKGKLYENGSDVSTSNSFDIFVDNLPNNPSITTRTSPTINVTNLIYNMGIPTVHTFSLIFDTTDSGSSRVYESINSEFKFVRGDLKIADIQIIGTSPNIDKANTKEIKLLDRTDINENGSYNLSDTNFNTNISSYYTGIKYTSSRLQVNNTLNINDKIYSLKTGDNGISPTQGPQVLTLKHYCDYNSFDNFSNSSPSIKITNDIVEIDNIEVFSSNMSTLNHTVYNSHNTLVKDSTLLFIDGKFQTNASQPYPVISSYSYQTQTLQNTGYTSSMATTSYALDGTSNGTGKKYKWIGFKLTTNDITTVVAANNTTYVNINSILRKYFDGDTFDKLKTSDNDDVIGFVKIENIIGNLSRNFNSLSPWDGISSNSSLTDLFDNVNKGSLYINTDNEWGPFVNPNKATNGIFIFIGLNNAINL